MAKRRSLAFFLTKYNGLGNSEVAVVFEQSE